MFQRGYLWKMYVSHIERALDWKANVENCKRLSCKTGQRTTVFSQDAEFLIPFHSLFHTTDSGGILRCCSIGHSNIEFPLLAERGLETWKLARSQNLQEIYLSFHHRVRNSSAYQPPHIGNEATFPVLLRWALSKSNQDYNEGKSTMANMICTTS